MVDFILVQLVDVIRAVVAPLLADPIVIRSVADTLYLGGQMLDRLLRS